LGAPDPLPGEGKNFPSPREGEGTMVSAWLFVVYQSRKGKKGKGGEEVLRTSPVISLAAQKA